jgi:hypothetical protein
MEAALLLPQQQDDDDHSNDHHDPYGAVGLLVGGGDYDGCEVSEIHYHQEADASLILFPAPLHQSASEDSYEQQHPQDYHLVHHGNNRENEDENTNKNENEPLSPHQQRRDKEKSRGARHHQHRRKHYKKKELKLQQEHHWKEEKEQDRYGALDQDEDDDGHQEEEEEEDVVLLAQNDDLMTDVHVLVQEYEALKQENVLLQQECAGFQQDLRVAQSELTSLRMAHRELEDAQVHQVNNKNGVIGGGVSVARDAWDEERQVLQFELREVRASRDKWKRRAYRVKEQHKSKDHLNNTTIKEDARSIFFKAKFLSHLCPPCHVHALTSLGEPVPPDVMMQQLRASSHKDLFENAGHGHTPQEPQALAPPTTKRNQKINKNPTTRMVSGIPKDICIEEHDGRLDDGMSALPSMAGVTTIHHRTAPNTAAEQQARSNKAKHAPQNQYQQPSGSDQDPKLLQASTALKQKSKRHKVLTTREALAKAVRIVNEIAPDGRNRSRRRRITAYRDKGPAQEDEDANRSASDVEWDLDELREDDGDDNDHDSVCSMQDEDNVNGGVGLGLGSCTSRRSKNSLSRSSGNSRDREHHDHLDRDHHGFGSKNNLSQKDLSSFFARDSKDNAVPTQEKANVSTAAHKHAIGEHVHGSGADIGGVPHNLSSHGRRPSRTSSSRQPSASSGTRTHASSSKWSSSHGEDHEEPGGGGESCRRKLENAHTATTTSSSRTSSLNGRMGSGHGLVHAPNPLNIMIIIEEEQPHMSPEFKSHKAESPSRLSRSDPSKK